MTILRQLWNSPIVRFAAIFLFVVTLYAPGLLGSYTFDDNPNIVDNKLLQITDTRLASLTQAALSSPSSEFKRPLASLSFAANYLATGLDPFWMKLTNLLIHLLNGVLVYFLTRATIEALASAASVTANGTSAGKHSRSVATWVALAWLVLPINLTSVLYVVQRMEAMAATFIFLGLLGYLAGRRRMLAGSRCGWALCFASIALGTGVGLLAKETAVMLPLYAFLLEWIVFRFRKNDGRTDAGIAGLFIVTLMLPMVAGLAWQVPNLLKTGYWSNRNFNLGTRLLTEARVIIDYIAWTIFPTPQGLSFYHDDFKVSQSLLRPWTTLASIVLLVCLAVAVPVFRRRFPPLALGIAFFLGCQLLTGTILPLELVYEHRNYFASYGIMLALIPFLASTNLSTTTDVGMAKTMYLPRYVLLGVLLAYWSSLTAFTAYAWGEPLRLASDLAARAPESPRAQYELGRTYILLSRYEPQSPFTKAAYEPLERAAALPDSTILPEQALIFLNSRMGQPLKDAWWESMYVKLRLRKPGVQDESSLESLAQCVRERHCVLPNARLTQAFLSALSQTPPSARLLAVYGSYAWNVLQERDLGERMLGEAVKANPREPAYRITRARMFAALGDLPGLRREIAQLKQMNIGGSLDQSISELSLLEQNIHSPDAVSSPGTTNIIKN